MTLLRREQFGVTKDECLNLLTLVDIIYPDGPEHKIIVEKVLTKAGLIEIKGKLSDQMHRAQGGSDGYKPTHGTREPLRVEPVVIIPTVLPAAQPKKDIPPVPKVPPAKTPAPGTVSPKPPLSIPVAKVAPVTTKKAKAPVKDKMSLDRSIQKKDYDKRAAESKASNDKARATADKMLKDSIKA